MSAWAEELRAKFPVTRTWTYLNTASAGPVSYETARAGSDVFQSMLVNGDGDWEAMLQNVDAAREALALLVGCQPRELAFTRNTSHSASLVAQMLWDAGHRKVVALEEEFPSSTLPFINRGFDVLFVKSANGSYPFEAISTALEGRTVLVASHVIYRSGAVIDPVELGRLAAAQGAIFVSCVTQSLGALRVNFRASGADFLVGTSHKWLCGGYGAGLLAMRSDLIGKFQWPAVGWVSQREPELMINNRLELKDAASVLEMGCSTLPSIHAAGAAARLWLSVGPDRVEARVRELTNLFRHRLKENGFRAPHAEEGRVSGITIVPFPHAEYASERLTEAHIQQVPRGGGIRFAFHAFNNEADIDRTLRGLIELREQLPADAFEGL
jgi:kynureninase